MPAVLESKVRELTRREVAEKYSHVSPLVILKTDVQRRGVTYTEAALDDYRRCGNHPDTDLSRI